MESGNPVFTPSTEGQVRNNCFRFCGAPRLSHSNTEDRGKQKGTLPYYINASPVEVHEYGFCAGVVSLRCNWEKCTVHSFNGPEDVSYMAVCVATYEYMYVNLGRQNVSLMLITGNMDREPSFYNLGRKQHFLLLYIISSFYPYPLSPPNNLNSRLSKFLCTRISFSLCPSLSLTCTFTHTEVSDQIFYTLCCF